jgi:hypothetical protein
VNHRELAEEEAAAWKALYPEQRAPYRKGIGSYWAVHDPTRPGYQVKLRHLIWLAHNDAIWVEVERGMPLGTAAGLVRKAKVGNISFEEALRRHKTGAYTATLPSGQTVYKHKSGSEAPPPPSEPAEFAGEWSSLRELIEDLARRALSGENPAQTEPLITNFLIDTKEGIAYMRRVLQRKGEFTVRRQKVIDACRFLRLEPPPLGTPANAEIFRKNAKQLRYENHQDRLGAAYDSEYYLNIGRALDYLEEYNKVIGGASCPSTATTASPRQTPPS